MTDASRRVCLCMMVRNESRVIERALASVADQVESWSITDTGSSDNTVALIKQFFADRGIPGQIHHAPFVDFGTTRTIGLQHALAQARQRGEDYLLILDADEELVVRDQQWKSQLDGAPCLLLQQGPVTYRVEVLVPTEYQWHYVGRTHEYLASPDPIPERRLFDGIALRHHGDGGSKADKFERDARLLRQTLAEQPDDPRSWFYLGESLLNGRIDIPAALDAFTRRAALGGFEEEAWYAAYRRGHCLESMMESPPPAANAAWPALVAYLQAWERRPWRAEPLTDAVRLAVRNQLPLLGFALGEHAATQVLPRHERADDILFVDQARHGTLLYDWLSLAAGGVGRHDQAITWARQALATTADDAEAARIARNIEHFGAAGPDGVADDLTPLLEACAELRSHGLHASVTVLLDAARQMLPSGAATPWQLDFEESIASWYVANRRGAAIAATNRTVTRRDTPTEFREAARRNRQYTISQLAASGWQPTPLTIPPDLLPTGYTPTNPSIARCGNAVRVLVRAVNYRLRDDGSYDFPDYIDSRHYLGELNRSGQLEGLREIHIPDQLRRDSTLVRGFEDCRIVANASDPDRIVLIANASHPDHPDRRAMYRLAVRGVMTGTPIVDDVVHLRPPDDSNHEKNWMPIAADGEPLRLVYTVDPTVVLAPGGDGHCRVVAQSTPPFWCADLRGGSQLVDVPLPEGGTGWLGWVHGLIREWPTRTYFHSLVLFDAELRLSALADPFVLRSQQIEFAAGCARIGHELLVTWGENDSAAWLGRLDVTAAVQLCRAGRIADPVSVQLSAS